MRLPLAILAAGVAIAACTFPDVDYADGGAAATAGTGGACPGLASCTAAAASCAAAADSAHAACMLACKIPNPGCTMKCDDAQLGARAGCQAKCAACVGPGCSDPGAATACQKAAAM